VAQVVIDNYGEAFIPSWRNQGTILDNLTREEKRFQRTVEAGLSHLEDLLACARGRHGADGDLAFDLYATTGCRWRSPAISPASRDWMWMRPVFARRWTHRLVSGGGKAIGVMGNEDVDVYRAVLERAGDRRQMDAQGVEYDPYQDLEVDTTILALVQDGAAGARSRRLATGWK
jgi:hypothetical protein